jgi:hypothetical protein
MARQRFIWPSLWSDPTLGRLDSDELLFYIGCFSLADDEGRILGDPAYLRAQIFPYREMSEDDIREIRANVSAACHAFSVYKVDGIDYICFTNWGDFQSPKYPKPSKLPGLERNGQESASRHGEIVHPGERQWVRRGYVKKHVREAVHARDGHKCVQCGSGSSLQIDHIEPVSLGGSNEPPNLQTLCRSCNSRKGNRPNTGESIPQIRESFPESGATGRAGLGRVGLDRAGFGSADPESGEDREERLREVGRMLALVKDADDLSETTLMGYAMQLPIGSVAKVRESGSLKGAGRIGVGYFVNGLKSELEERAA